MSTGLLLYRPPHARDEATARVGMLLFLGSWAMMFAALFFALGVVRCAARCGHRPRWALSRCAGPR